MGIQGLAEGLLAGFNVADTALSRRDALKLREQENQRQQDNTDRLFNQTQEQNRWNREYQQQRDAVQDKRWAMGQALAQERFNQERDEHAYQRGQNEREQRLRQEMPLVKAGYDALHNGQYEQANRIFSQVSADSPLHPAHYFGEQPLGVAKAIIQEVPRVLAGELDYNGPEAMAILNQAFDADLKRSVGQRDPASGKTITDTRLIHLGRSADHKGFIGTLQVTYDDGSSAEKPLTRHGSADPRDTVPVIPVEALLGGMYNYVRTVGFMNQPQQVEFMHRLVNPESVNQGDNSMIRDYQRYAYELDKEEADALYGIEKPSKRAETQAYYDGLRERLDQRFGYGAADDPGGQTLPAALQRWAGKDTDRQAFVREGSRRGVLPAAVTARQLDAMYADARGQSPAGKARSAEGGEALKLKVSALRRDLQQASSPESRARIAGELMAMERALTRSQSKPDPRARQEPTQAGALSTPLEDH
ncbi:cytokinesis protein SepA [Edwardsiella piscicida]|uniref:cytokinesis protein SepA n=1 Tax=Edwardsiella piscicida TaxID=1263550 RepID=UPI000A07CBF9|nr:cytokinesis protein SepA [Edwardsiella piscicida]EKS7767196.1 cytokinesis protein SepA [Edwardsiella piscicida]UBU80031.1 cytokinesis protein SepA [Edwardsiella piscicida]UCQ32753.1 cytokinesis protein SepA [Edwardsiella piscicida]UCQ59071.1 cytokinesis protein SepA [Edwardsiella piscicida]